MKKLSRTISTLSCRALALSALFTGIFLSLAAAAPQGPESFLPTWQLLNSQEKQLFISGYLQGWHDAARVTRVAEEHVSQNPEQALSSLKTIRSLYELDGKNANSLVKGIDEFYSEPDNASAALSMAVTAASKRHK